MTKEEALRGLKENLCVMCAYGSQNMDTCDIRGCDNRDFIKALKQEPCDDAISRQYLLDNCVVDRVSMPYVPINRIENAPSVNPQKIGHWIYDDECREHGHCSECGYGRVDLVDGKPHNFCRRCGAKMEIGG